METGKQETRIDDDVQEFYHQNLTDLDRIDLVEFVRSGERHTDPH